MNVNDAGQVMKPILFRELYVTRMGLNDVSAAVFDANIRRLGLLEIWDERQAIAVLSQQEAEVFVTPRPPGEKSFLLNLSTTRPEHRVITPLGYSFIRACQPPNAQDPQETLFRLGARGGVLAGVPLEEQEG